MSARLFGATAEGHRQREEAIVDMVGGDTRLGCFAAAQLDDHRRRGFHPVVEARRIDSALEPGARVAS